MKPRPPPSVASQGTPLGMSQPGNHDVGPTPSAASPKDDPLGTSPGDRSLGMIWDTSKTPKELILKYSIQNTAF